ncbi:MAG: dihydrolipoyllysine-residue acetyltransferase component of acetoin cleaving system [Nitrospirales bacterium]|nr:MAG: dihydrolipoyllysine-residue acetyltransferase component of acetoin cleaving system [Nitrospirales bacterium]
MNSIPVIIPQDNVNDESVTLLSWSVANGELVSQGQAIAEIETSKAVMEIEAPAAGILEYSLEPGSDIDVGALLCRIRSEAQEGEVGSESLMTEDVSVASVDVKTNGQGSQALPANENNQTHFTKKAQALLEQRGLPLERFAGRGLVRTTDILLELGEMSPTQTPPPAQRTVVQGERSISRVSPIPAFGIPFQTEKLSKGKRTEIGYLSSGSQNALPSVITVAVPTRGLRAAVEQHKHIDASVTAVILFEVARLLRHYPWFNAFYQNGHVNVYDEVNIGFAIDGDFGLKVPVIRTADTKSIAEITNEIQELMIAYLENTLSSANLQGGTCTVTDLSGEGVFAFHPLLNQGQSAILGVGGEFFLPGSREGIFNLILAFDHQVSEGRQAARFLRELGEHLQAYEAALAGASSSDQDAEDVSRLSCARCLTPLADIQEWDKFEHWDHFMVPMVKPDGQRGYLCSVCVRGW